MMCVSIARRQRSRQIRRNEEFDWRHTKNASNHTAHKPDLRYPGLIRPGRRSHQSNLGFMPRSTCASWYPWSLNSGLVEETGKKQKMIVAQLQRTVLAHRRVAAVAMPAFVGGYRMLSSGKVIYTGFYADKLRMLKRISFGTCMMAIFGLPALLFSVKEGMPLATQLSIVRQTACCGVCVFYVV